MRLLYADDLENGAVFDLGRAKVSREDILDFGRRWDPLPNHTDEEAAAQGPFGGLIASGIHTLSVLQRLQADAFLSRSAVIAGRGMGPTSLPAPVRPGDVLHGRVEIRDVSLRGDARAVVRSRGTLTNGSGVLVLEVHGEMIWARQPQDPREGRVA